jgi:glycosyltransferase involved in cell wall biosynthesis
VAPHVTVTGLQQDVRPLLGACDVLTLCSTAVETFSLAALEAMALARPVVHSDVGGAAEMIRDGEQGFLFPVNDTAALVGRLHALADPAVRERLEAQSCDIVGGSSEALAELVKREQEKWGRIIRAKHITVD